LNRNECTAIEELGITIGNSGASQIMNGYCHGGVPLE